MCLVSLEGGPQNVLVWGAGHKMSCSFGVGPQNVVFVWKVGHQVRVRLEGGPQCVVFFWMVGYQMVGFID